MLCESLSLAPWSKVKEWRPPVNLAPLMFSSLEPLRAPLFVPLWRPIRHVDLSFSFFFTFPSLFFAHFFFPFPFLFLIFGAPSVTGGGGPEAPKAPPGYAPGLQNHLQSVRKVLVRQHCVFCKSVVLLSVDM